MSEFSFPFNSVQDEEGKDDRVYYAEDFAKYFMDFISNGVYPNPSNGLYVRASGASMVLTVYQGSAYINGHCYVLKEEDMQIALSTAHMSYNRKDTIVIQLNLTERWMRVLYKEGKASANPLPPALLRNDDVYELCLAEILVKSGTQIITQAEVTDKRLDSAVCGIVKALIDHVDTTVLFKQYETYLNQQIALWNSRHQQQAADWRSQMNNQQAGYNNKLNEIENRYSTLSQTYTNNLNQRITEWDTAKAEQTKDLQAQLNTQQSDFNGQMGDIEGWYASVRTDIAKEQTFDFDNLCSFPGCTLNTVTLSNNKYRETVSITTSGTKVAERMTETLSNGYRTC